MRTEKITWFLDLAQRCAQQGTCLRRNYGVVIVDDCNTIVSTGYTGAPSECKDCLEIGVCWREKHNIPPGSGYEKCRSVHAEMNALIQAGKKARNGVMYLCGIDAKTGEIVGHLPCFLCAKMLVNSGMARVIVRQPDGSHTHHTPHEIYEIGRAKALDDS